MGRLFWKFFFATWVAQAVAVLAISTGIWVKDRNAARRDAQVDYGPPAVFMVDAAAQTLRHGGMAALRGLLGGIEGSPVYVIDAAGRDVLGRPTEPALIAQLRRRQAQEPASHALQQVSVNGQTWLFYVSRPQLRELRMAALARPRGPGEGGGPPPHHPRNGYFPWQPMLLALLGSVLSSALLAWHFARPIRRLRAAFDAVSAGKLDTRVPAPATGGDELVALGRDFNHMTAQLQSLLDAQRRLLHDVSHEMRSPLARLQAAIGLARQRPDRVEPSLARIERESERMDAMIGEVLALARLDAGVADRLTDDVAVADLVAEVVDDARFEAQAAGKTVELGGDAGAIVRGNAELLHSAVENIVRNAVKHTADGSTVRATVACDAAARQVTIAVCDQGPGVPDGELELIFRPFQRGSDSKLPGHGLGLAIAERVVHTHGGTIRARNRANGGLCVEITLPLAG